MRAYLPAYDALTPDSLDHALELLDTHPEEYVPFAGGTDLMVLLDWGKLPRKKYLNIWNLSELKGIQEDESFISLGGLTTYTEIQASEVLQKEFPNLCQAARWSGAWAIQNRGTLGGNIANASPAADSSPALLSYGAELEIVSRSGVRRLPYSEFHTGYKEMRLEKNEIIRAILLPRSSVENCHHYYRKVGTRKAQAISKVCLAAFVKWEGNKIKECRIALGSVAPTVIRCPKSEEILTGKTLSRELKEEAKATLGQEISPIDDVRSTKDYRLEIAVNIFDEFLDELGGCKEG